MNTVTTPGSQLQSIEVGSGRIASHLHGSEAIFSELWSTYPLKLLSPRTTEEGVAIVYVVSYGGGLVGGDSINLSVDVGGGTKLVLLSQGSTKVFKTRQGERSSIVLRGSSSMQQVTTTQSMDVTVSAQGAIFVLPDPVTCFRSASYSQIQTFRLVGDASLVLLDWVTSGRKSLGEEWAFSRYYSLNKVIVDGKPIARDVLLLEEVQAQVPADDTPQRSLKDRLSPYSCYAMLLLYGPLTRGVIAEMTTQYEAITVFNTASPQRVLWSLSPICGGAGCVVRTAGVETEDVKNWLKNALRGLENVIGVDVYRKAFL